MSNLFISRGVSPLSGVIVVSAQNIEDAKSIIRCKVGHEFCHLLTNPEKLLGLEFTPTINNNKFCINGIIKNGQTNNDYAIDVNYHE